ncbi:MAG TPA: Imm63 family immunity protein [Aggregatilineaceae bacterium]|nr:Imm63 family immunity protein [Aggregatilineaceae bacterium]
MKRDVLLDLDTIRRRVESLAQQIGAPPHLLPTYGLAHDAAQPYIEINRDGYHYGMVERGEELERRTTHDPQRLLYWIFVDVTFGMAAAYEAHHRVPDQDSRRLLFNHQLELLGQLDAAWKAWQTAEIDLILKHFPYEDRAE